MPRDERGKNRKFGQHKDRAVGVVSEQDLFNELEKEAEQNKYADQDSGEEEQAPQKVEEKAGEEKVEEKKGGKKKTKKPVYVIIQS